MNINPNEIKKGLECCTQPTTDCDNCPCSKQCDGVEHLTKALAYINQLEEKIDDLERDTIPKLQWSLKRANEYGIKTDKENQQLKAEVERLNNSGIRASSVEDWLKHCNKLRAEAYKEFASRLKEKYKKDFNSTWSSVYNPIDNLVKEMVGDE